MEQWKKGLAGERKKIIRFSEIFQSGRCQQLTHIASVTAAGWCGQCDGLR